MILFFRKARRARAIEQMRDDALAAVRTGKMICEKVQSRYLSEDDRQANADAVDLFTYCRRTYGSLCSWDGPAGIIATDGTILAGQVDRMGLRPVRWCSDERGWLYISSESGVF